MEIILIQVHPSRSGDSEEQTGGPRGGEQVESSDVASIGRALKAA